MKPISSLAPLHVLIGVAAALAIGAAPSAASAPDSVELAQLQTSLAQVQAVRVTGAFGMHILRDVHLDGHGVSSSRWGPGTVRRPALILGEGVALPPTPPPIGWDRVSRIEVGTRRTAKGAATGGVLGALLGAAIWSTIPLGDDGARGSAVVVIGVPGAAGLLLGGWLGSETYDWRSVHPREVVTAR